MSNEAGQKRRVVIPLRDTGFSSEIGTKLRESPVGQAGGSCYSWAALSSNDSKTLYMYIRPSRTCQTLHSGRAPGDEIFIINQGPTRDGPLCTLPKFCNTYLEQFSFFARPIRPNPTNRPNCFQFRRTWSNLWENGGATPSRSTTCAGATAT